MNIFDVNSKIESNLKQLDFYHDLYQKLQSKFSFLVVIYSFIFFYLIELFKYIIEIKWNFIDIIFLIFFIIFLVALIISIVRTYDFLKPIDISYLNQPKFFYNDILEEYKTKLETDDEATLNEYVNHTYLLECEKALENNISAYKEKSHKFYLNFKTILQTLIIYIILSSFVIFEKRNSSNEIHLQNYKEIINYLKKDKMAQEKPKVDPKMVISTQPVTVKQSGSLSAQTKQTTKTKVFVNTIKSENKEK